MDDLGLNQWLLDNYGTTVEGLPLFKLVWSTNLTEKRKGTFRDYYGEVIIREVTEVRECLKYPMAQDRWVLEKICEVHDTLYGIELFSKYSYEGIYIFQDKSGEYLPLNPEMLEAAMFLYLTWARMPEKGKLEFRMAQLAERDKQKKEKLRQKIGEGMRSPSFMPLIE